MNNAALQDVVKKAIKLFYDYNIFLIKEDLGERCLVHQFANCLEECGKFRELGYYVDCEYNRSHLNGRSGIKDVLGSNGNFIDIIVTKRNGNPKSDLLCIEAKRAGKYTKSAIEGDFKKLEVLTNGNKYSYSLGAHIVFAKNHRDVKTKFFSR